MKKTMTTALAFSVGVCAWAPSAHADPPQRDNNYAYNFDDDKLLGKDGVGNVPVINVRPGGRRDLLHRPRLQFVQEMLKSVENM